MHHEAKDRDPVWDCTLIALMRKKGSTVVNPIYHWKDCDVWEYIKQNGIKTNPLYQRGYHRVGCIGCPMATYKQKQKEFAEYPKFKDNYIKAFQKMVDVAESKGKDFSTYNDGSWKDGESVFNWWIQEYRHNVKGQMTIDDILKEMEESNGV